MKNEPWIDRVYKDNLQTREIKLDYAHWIQAEKLILEQERQKKKKRFLFWMLTAGIVIIFSIGSVQYLKPAVINDLQQDSPPSEHLTPLPGSEDKNEADTMSAASMPVALAEGTEAHLIKSQERHDQKTSHQNVIIMEKTHGANKLPISIKRKWTSEQPDFVNKSKKGKFFENKMNKSEVDPNATKYESVNLIRPSINENKGNESIVQSKQFKIDIAFLEKKYTSLNYGNRIIRLNAVQTENRMPIKVYKEKWAEKGIRTTLAQETNSLSKGNSISQAGLELYYHRSINKIAFFGLSAGYLSNFNKVRYAQVLTEYKYQGFGAQVNNYGIKPNWLQYGFIQLSGGLNWKKHRLMMGARPEFLFATKGKLDQIEFSDPTKIKTLNDAQISSVNQGWLQNDVMNKISVTAYLGYEFRIMERIGLGIQLNHIVKSPYKPLQGGIIQNGLASWNTGFRLSYILK